MLFWFLKKINGLQPGFWLGLTGLLGHPEFLLSLFFLKPVQFQIQINPLGRIGFQNYGNFC